MTLLYLKYDFIYFITPIRFDVPFVVRKNYREIIEKKSINFHTSLLYVKNKHI